MKKFEKIFFSMIAMIMMVAVGSVFTSCTNDDDDFRVPAQEAQLDQALDQDSVAPMTRGMNIVNDCGAQIRSDQTLPFPGEPVHGIPGQTVYKFFVANPSSDVIGVAVKFTAPDGNVYTHNMQQNAAGNWYLERTLSQAGHYTLKYHLMRSGGNTTISTPTPSYIDNTKVYLSNGVLHMFWPFGYEDGTSPSNHGLWTLNCGPGGSEEHSNNYFFSYDWNWNTSDPDSDNGKILCSPIDGTVIGVTPYSTSFGTAYKITVEQKYGTYTYRHDFCHIQQNTIASIGAYVPHGTPIAYLGSTGASSPHVHCQLKKVGTTANVPLSYDVE